MDPADVHKNEQVLGSLVDQADKKFTALVGMMALGILTEHLPADQYQAFVSECIENAHEFVKHKMLGADKAAEAGAQPGNV